MNQDQKSQTLAFQKSINSEYLRLLYKNISQPIFWPVSIMYLNSAGADEKKEKKERQKEK